MTTPLDSPWKDILEAYFPQFMAFFFTDAFGEIDWSQGFTFLDGELQQITREAETGWRYVDKLVKVYLRDGAERWVAVHIEVQSQKEADFGQRIFTYFARLQDKFQREVASLVILGDTDKDWRPSFYETGLFGCQLQFTFPIVKLVEYKKRVAELESSDNPFSVVVLAHLAAQATKDKRSQQRHRHTMLYERGDGRQEVLDLYRFIDWVLTLPPELEKSFDQDLAVYEGEQNRPYITSIERNGIRRAKGKIALELLQQGMSVEEVAAITELSISEVESFADEQAKNVQPQK
jgi:predicted transposase/invertase (TIGR01784 family)